VNALYDREREADNILRDLIALRVRLDRLIRNLDFPLHDASGAREKLSSAIDMMARVRPGRQRTEDREEV
jgi:hypothetical protein